MHRLQWLICLLKFYVHKKVNDDLKAVRQTHVLVYHGPFL